MGMRLKLLIRKGRLEDKSDLERIAEEAYAQYVSLMVMKPVQWLLITLSI